MQNEPSLMQIMRTAILPHLPQKAFLKRDRSEALLATNAPAFDAGFKEIPGFMLEEQGLILHILPDESWIHRLEAEISEPPDYFCKTLLRFKGERANRQNLLLFVQGLKLLDAGFTPTQTEILAYDRALRQRTAIALRGGCGGGLYAAGLLLAQINTLYKGGYSI